jgi:DNA-binding FadR family transcriptional regulator
MGAVLDDSTIRERVWTEHAAILELVLAGEADAADAAARRHAERAGADTAQKLALFASAA